MKYQTKIQFVTSIWLLTLIASIVALIFWKSDWRFALFVFALLGFFLLVLVSVRITQKHVARITPLLFEECDPEKFLGAVFASMTPGRPKRAEFIWTMLLYEGQYAAGRYEDARSELANLKRFGKGWIGAYQRAAYNINLAEVSIALGRPEAAEKALDECHRTMESTKIPMKMQQVLTRGYQAERCKLSIFRGCFDGAEQTFTEILAQAENEYARVGAKHHLALIYAHSGDTENGREALEYVAAHGNQLHFAALARERLGLPCQSAGTRLWHKEGISC